MPAQKVTKEDIIEKSIEVFRKQGFHKTSMSDLAKACDLQKGSFYYYFKSKDALMEEVLKYVHRYYKKRVFSIAYDKKLSATERMFKIFKEQEPIITQDLAGCLFGNVTLETISVKTEFKAFLKEFFTDWSNAFKEIFLECYSEEEATKLAQQSVMEIEGALMFMRVYDDKELLKEACRRVIGKFK